MRISTAYDNLTNIESINERRSAISDIQAQISSGRRVVEPKDDPVAAANAERVRGSLARIELERRSIGYAQQFLGQADGALSDASQNLQSARELLVSATNPSYSPAERESIARQLRGMREQLISVANRTNGAGSFLFGGQGANAAPFVGADAITYQAQRGERTVGQELEFTVSLDGNAAFTEVAAENAPPENIFDRMLAVARTLEDSNASATTVRAEVNAAISGIDRTIGSLSLRRTQVGEQLRQIDEHEASMLARDGVERAYLSSLIDVDLAKAISDMSINETTLDASIKTYRTMSDLSLFKYL